MNDTLNQQQDNILGGQLYTTPFNVDLFEVKSEDYFTAYTKMVLTLPESIRSILMDSSTAEFIEENLGPSFGLNKESKIEITRIIRDILLGDVSLNSMPSLISSKLNTDQNTSVQIANKIVNDLFGPAIEDIKKLQAPKISEKPDLKIDPSINRNNIVDLRNK